MKCVNCGSEAGRKGNRHVKSRKFTCTRMVRKLETKRKWYGGREDNWVMMQDDSLNPYECGLTDWFYSDERSYSDSRFDDYYSGDYSRSTRDDSSSSSYDPPAKSSDDSPSSSSSYDYTPAPTYDSTPSPSYDSGPSWSSSGSDSGSSGSTSSGSYDSGSSGSSDSGNGW